MKMICMKDNHNIINKILLINLQLKITTYLPIIDFARATQFATF